MTRRSTVSSYALSALAVLTGLIVACRDTQAPSAPLAPQSDPASLAAEPAYAGSARQLARMIALSMKDRAVRVRWRDALRASPLTEHILRLHELSGNVMGRSLLSAVGRANGKDADAVSALIAALPAMDVYLPVREHRLEWTVDRADVVVGVVYQRKSEYARAFNAAGDSMILSGKAGAPDYPLFIISPSKTSGRRISPQTRVAGTVVQDADDGEVAGTVSYGGSGRDSLKFDLADILQERRTARAGRLDQGVTFEPRQGTSASLAFRAAASTSSAPAPSDTTLLYAFKIDYIADIFDGEIEPFFKTYYHDHDPGTDNGIIGYGEIRFSGLQPTRWYYPILPLIFQRLTDSTSATMETQLHEDNVGTDENCGWKAYWFAATRIDFGRIQINTQAIDNPDGRFPCYDLHKGDTSGNIQIYWRAKPPNTHPMWVRIFAGDSTIHPYFEAGCPAYPPQYVQAKEPTNSFLLYQYVLNHSTVSSDNPAIASFVQDADGYHLNFNSPGTTTIRATLFGVSTSRVVTADPFVGHIAVNPSGPQVVYGHTQQLATTVYNTSSQVITQCGVSANNMFPLLPTIWTTSNAAVATVSSTGIVQAVAVGTATITGKVGGFAAVSNILVPPATSFTSTPNAPYNQNVTVTAALTPAGSYYYDWAYTPCNTGHALHDCDGTYYALPSGINVKTATTKVRNTDRYVIFRLNEKLTSTGTVLNSLQYRVNGAGEVIGGGGGCTPGIAC